MEPVKNPVARVMIYLLLTLYALFSVTSFLWTTLQSLKNQRDANARTPKLIPLETGYFEDISFTVTFDNYSDLWITQAPDNILMLGGIFIAAVVVLTLLGMYAEYVPISNVYIYWGILGISAVMLWAIPQYVVMAEFYDYFINSIIVTIGTVIISISIGCLAAYGLARYAGLLAVVILLSALAFRALPRLAFVLPYYQMGQWTGLHDTHFLLIITLVTVNQPFTIWMLRSFFMDIPKELEESAMVDGANRFTAFRKIIVPLMWPGIISTALFTLLLAYHEFLLARVLTQQNWTLPVAIARFAGGESPTHLTLAAAAAVSATIPIVIVILVFQKQLVKGLMAGAVKG